MDIGKDKDAAKCEDVDWRVDNRPTSEAEGRSRIQRGAWEQVRVGSKHMVKGWKRMQTSRTNRPRQVNPDNT